MTGRRARRGGAIGLLFVLLVPATALAARLWLLTASPMSLTAGVATAVTLTAKNTGGSGGGDEITCVTIQVGSGFTVSAVSIVSVRGTSSGPAFAAWQVVWPGGSVVTVKDPGDDYPLIGSSPPDDEIVFRITGVATSAGVMTWTGDAADKPGGATSTSCGSGDQPVATLAFTVVPGLLPTPAPSPTPAPTPSPAPTPTPAPSPTPASTPIPSPLATATPGRSQTPSPTPTATATGPVTPAPAATEGSRSPDPTPTADPDSSDSPAPSPFERLRGDDGSAGGSTGSASPTAETDAGSVSLAIGDDDLSPASRGGGARMSGLDGALVSALQELPGGLLAWSYPAVVLTVPGLLLIVAVLAQAAGALAWLPIVRRSLGGLGPRRGRRDRGSPPHAGHRSHP